MALTGHVLSDHSPLVIIWNSVLVQLKVNSRGCPSQDRLSLLYLFVYSNSVLSTSSLQRYSNRKMCWINLHVIHMLIGIWYLCLSSLSLSFLYIYCNSNTWSDGLSGKLCTKLNWDLSYHIWLLCSVAPPRSRGSSCGCSFWPFSISPSQEHLALTSLHHRLKEKEHPIFNIQQPTLNTLLNLWYS